MLVVHWFLLLAALMPYAVVPLMRGRDFDNSRPRDGYAAAEGLQKRALGAHLNSFEVFPLFAVAVLVALQAGGDMALMNGLAGLWLASRVAYIIAYLKDMPTVRSTLFGLGLLLVLALFTMPLWGPYPEGL